MTSTFQIFPYSVLHTHIFYTKPGYIILVYVRLCWVAFWQLMLRCFTLCYRGTCAFFARLSYVTLFLFRLG